MTKATKRQPIPFGKYLLLDRIAVGGMAEVWRAKTFAPGGFEMLVAVKRILPSAAEDEAFISMFIDEAKITVQLEDASIGQLLELGQVADSYFIAMEYISGKDLRSIFERCRKNREPAPIPLSCYVIAQACQGLDCAHRKKSRMGKPLNIVHRDVSPANILCSYDGEVKVIDFGIAKAVSNAITTQAGVLKGKFGYMSPEQVRNRPLDRRSDIFAIGVCLYEMLTGERLFVGETDVSVMQKVSRADVLPPTQLNRRIPDELERVVLKSLTRDADDRYQYASEVADDLRKYMLSTGAAFTRKNLAAYMRLMFAAELEEERTRLQEYAEIRPPPDQLAFFESNSIAIQAASKETAAQSTDRGDIWPPRLLPVDTPSSQDAAPSSESAVPGPPFGTQATTTREETTPASSFQDPLSLELDEIGRLVEVPTRATNQPGAPATGLRGLVPAAKRGIERLIGTADRPPTASEGTAPGRLAESTHRSITTAPLEPDHSTLIRSIGEVVDELVGPRHEVTNAAAYAVLRGGARQAELARHADDVGDARLRRLQAAQELLGAAERSLHGRLTRVGPEEKAHWLSVLEAGRSRTTERTLSTRQVLALLASGELPSLKSMAHWVSVQDAPEPEELAEWLRAQLGVPIRLRTALFALGQSRNVLAHRQTYEARQDDLHEASTYLDHVDVDGATFIDISEEKLETLRIACTGILQRR